MSRFRNSFTKYNISGTMADILMASWRSGTENSTSPTLSSGSSFLVKGKLIVILHKSAKLQTSWPIHTLKACLHRTETIRDDEQQFFISFVQQHKSASRDTISRWARIVLQKSGIDTKIFTSHSTRAASASKAKQKNVPLNQILSQVGWSTAHTFRKFYDKPIVSSYDSTASAILRSQTLKCFLLSHLFFSMVSRYSSQLLFLSLFHCDATCTRPLWEKIW